jgi:5'-3' exonuclease
MGISGLLPQLKSITTHVNVSKYAGQTMAVDGYVWLHRGVFTCCEELCLGKPTDKYIKYFINQVNLLRHHGVKPYIVFDGGPLPAKAGTEKERSASRDAAKQRAVELQQQGRGADARALYAKACDVTPQMAAHVINALKELNVQYVVAPYEADAQMAFLSKQGLVDVVLSEDSDMIPYECKTVLFKMDRYGEGQEIEYANLQRNRSLSFRGWTADMFLTMCILSGCDYLDSPSGLGVKKAHRLVAKYKRIPQILRGIRLEAQVLVPRGYDVGFHRAFTTFRHQRVYDPRTKQLCHCTPLKLGAATPTATIKAHNPSPRYLNPSPLPVASAAGAGAGTGAVQAGGGTACDETSMEYLGANMPAAQAAQIAEGLMDPVSMELFPDETPVYKAGGVGGMSAGARHSQKGLGQTKLVKGQSKLSFSTKPKQGARAQAPAGGVMGVGAGPDANAWAGGRAADQQQQSRQTKPNVRPTTGAAALDYFRRQSALTDRGPQHFKSRVRTSDAAKQKFKPPRSLSGNSSSYENKTTSNSTTPCSGGGSSAQVAAKKGKGKTISPPGTAMSLEEICNEPIDADSGGSSSAEAVRAVVPKRSKYFTPISHNTKDEGASSSSTTTTTTTTSSSSSSSSSSGAPGGALSFASFALGVGGGNTRNVATSPIKMRAQLRRQLPQHLDSCKREGRGDEGREDEGKEDEGREDMMDEANDGDNEGSAMEESQECSQECSQGVDDFYSINSASDADVSPVRVPLSSAKTSSAPSPRRKFHTNTTSLGSGGSSSASSGPIFSPVAMASMRTSPVAIASSPKGAMQGGTQGGFFEQFRYQAEDDSRPLIGSKTCKTASGSGGSSGGSGGRGSSGGSGNRGSGSGSGNRAPQAGGLSWNEFQKLHRGQQVTTQDWHTYNEDRQQHMASSTGSGGGGGGGGGSWGVGKQVDDDIHRGRKRAYSSPGRAPGGRNTSAAMAAGGFSLQQFAFRQNRSGHAPQGQQVYAHRQPQDAENKLAENKLAERNRHGQQDAPKRSKYLDSDSDNITSPDQTPEQAGVQTTWVGETPEQQQQQQQQQSFSQEQDRLHGSGSGYVHGASRGGASSAESIRSFSSAGSEQRTDGDKRIQSGRCGERGVNDSPGLRHAAQRLSRREDWH